MEHALLRAHTMRVQLSRNHDRGLMYLAVEFGVSPNRIIEDALRLYQSLIIAERESCMVWSGASAMLYGKIPYQSTHFARFGGIGWRILSDISRGSTYVGAHEVRVSSTDFSHRAFWSGAFGEEFERCAIRRMGEMLGLIYLFYDEYRRGGAVWSFVWQRGGEPKAVDLQHELGIYNTRP